MTQDEKIEVAHGSGNVFRDAGFPNPDVEQAKAILSAQIIKALKRQGLSVRKAQALTKVQAADFSRIRNADLKRFTIDWLMTILGKLEPEVNVKMKFSGGSKRTSLRQEISL